MKPLAFTIFILLILFSCTSDELPKPGPIYILSSTRTSYSIHLSNDTITNFSKYINDLLINTTYFYFNDSIDIKLVRNANNIIVSKKIFHIGSNGYADYSTDSVFNDTSSFVKVSKITYLYDNGYLIEQNVDSGNPIITYFWVDGNEKYINGFFASSQFGCSNGYTYDNSLQNKLDIYDFTNHITGKFNKNLIKYVSYYLGCPSGPSTYEPTSHFQYDMNSSGYVSKMYDYYFPSYHAYSKDQTTGTISTTYFNY